MNFYGKRPLRYVYGGAGCIVGRACKRTCYYVGGGIIAADGDDCIYPANGWVGGVNGGAATVGKPEQCAGTAAVTACGNCPARKCYAHIQNTVAGIMARNVQVMYTQRVFGISRINRALVAARWAGKLPGGIAKVGVGGGAAAQAGAGTVFGGYAKITGAAVESDGVTVGAGYNGRANGF